jgi:hypothetical protein
MMKTFLPLEIHESCYYQIVFSMFSILHFHLCLNEFKTLRINGFPWVEDS